MNFTRCPNCNSASVGLFRLDNDWGYNGSWYPVNEGTQDLEPHPEAYSESAQEMFAKGLRPNVRCYICTDCEEVWRADN